MASALSKTTSAAVKALPKTFRRFPKPLFRINTGPLIKLRPKRTADHVPQTQDYDIVTTGLKSASAAPFFTNMWVDSTHENSGREEQQQAAEEERDGPARKVTPRMLLGEHVEPRRARTEYEGPNGLRLRLNTAFTQHYFLRQWRGESPVVFAVQAGTPLPQDLVLVRPNPKSEEWSLEPARRMTLQELNDTINNFLTANAAKLTREQWHTAFPHATEPVQPIGARSSKWTAPGRNALTRVVRRGLPSWRRRFETRYNQDA